VQHERIFVRVRSKSRTAYRRVRVTRANGLRSPELSLSMCHCHEAVARSYTIPRYLRAPVGFKRLLGGTSKRLSVLFRNQKHWFAASRDRYGVCYCFLRRGGRCSRLQSFHRGEMKLGDPIEGRCAAVRRAYDFGCDKSLDALERLWSDHRRMILRVCSLEGLNVSRRGIENNKFRARHGFLLLLGRSRCCLTDRAKAAADSPTSARALD